MLLATTTLIALFFPILYRKILDSTLLIWNHLNEPYDNLLTVTTLAREGLIAIFWTLFWPFSIIAAIAIIINLLQTGVIFSWYPLKPRWNHLNIFHGANYRKYFSGHALLRMFFGQFKIFLVIIGTWKFLQKELPTISTLYQWNAYEILIYLVKKTLLLSFIFTAGYLLLAFIDLLYQKWKFQEELKMSRRELKEEIRQSEGSIQYWKSAIQNKMQTWGAHSLAGVVPKANLVVATGSPTGQTIALQYEPEKMLAPVCVAKGVSKKGESIQRIARKYQIPIVQNSELAHSLFKEMKEGKAIPEQFYSAIAKLYVERQVLKR